MAEGRQGCQAQVVLAVCGRVLGTVMPSCLSRLHVQGGRTAHTKSGITQHGSFTLLLQCCVVCITHSATCPCPTCCPQVLWVDLLTRAEFESGFGSHTPMFSGQTKCVRYYMVFERALGLLRELLLREGHAYDASNRKVPLGSASTCEAIRAAKTAEDMWLVGGWGSVADCACCGCDAVWQHIACALC